MKSYGILFILVLMIQQAVLANRHEKFKGEARENDMLIYIENHDVTFDDNNSVLEAITTYVDPNGKLLGTLHSDFRRSLSLPEHVFRDERTKGKYGIRRLNDKIILFNQDDGKAEVTKVLDSEEDKSRIQIGCQGFNYFLKDKIDDLREIKSLPVLFMIPGDLSTYKFVLKLVEENSNQTIVFKVKIENGKTMNVIINYIYE